MEIKGYNESGTRCKYDIKFSYKVESDKKYDCKCNRYSKLCIEGTLLPVMEVLIDEIFDNQRFNTLKEIYITNLKKYDKFKESYIISIVSDNDYIELEVISSMSAFKVLYHVIEETTGKKVNLSLLNHQV